MNAFCINGKTPWMQDASVGNYHLDWFYDSFYVLIQVIIRIPDNTFDSSKFVERQLSGRGGPKTKLLSFNDALELIMVLPGDVARETRVQFAEILKRYMAGDKSLIAEINANAESSSPIAQMARASMAAPSEDETIMLGFKRRREELELFKMAEEVESMRQTRITSLNKELERISDPSASKLDDRTRLLFKDTYTNMLLNTMTSQQQGQQAAIANGPSPNAPISISGVATELGYKPTSADLQRIGIDLKKRYVRKHGKEPTKHDQLCSGRVTKVNSYSEQDRPLVNETLHAYYFKPRLYTPTSSDAGSVDGSDD